MHKTTLWITAMVAVVTLLFAYHLNLAGTTGKAGQDPACATVTATATAAASATATATATAAATDPDCATTARPGENK